MSSWLASTTSGVEYDVDLALYAAYYLSMCNRLAAHLSLFRPSPLHDRMRMPLHTLLAPVITRSQRRSKFDDLSLLNTDRLGIYEAIWGATDSANSTNDRFSFSRDPIIVWRLVGV